MLKTYQITLLTILLAVLCCTVVSAQEFRVQVAAFIKQKPFTYFAYSGVNDVYANIDQNEIHRYYLSESYPDAETAEQARRVLVKRGFPNAQIIDMEKEKSLCQPNDPAARQGAIYTNINTEHLYIRNIFFGFDQSKLTLEAQRKLDEVYKKMKADPSLVAYVQGHTDASGSAESNIKVSYRRARQACNYLISKGIHAERLTAKLFGESTPIAINLDSNGEDVPNGRKYNRRAVITLVDQTGEVVNDIERMRDVPGHLRINEQTLRQQIIYADLKK